MVTKSILLALADPQALADTAQALGDGWDVASVSSEAEALAQLEQRSFDALVADFNLGSTDASQLLNQAFEKRPETIRFVVAYEADLALVEAYVSGPHEILPKPVEPASLKSRIECCLAPADAKCNPTAAERAADAGAAAAVPEVYVEILTALESPDISRRKLGKIIARDASLTSDLLRLANSPYLYLPCDLTDAVEAVELVGLEAVKALVTARQFLAEHSELSSGYLSLENLWQHSINVAQLARDLVLFETKDRVLAAEALAAGLLHDLGKLVLASRFDEWYGRVHSLARNQPVALWDIEKEMFGANHGEIGGCQAGMWNMSSSVVEAIAFHHEPPLGEHQDLTPLTAVHVANVLAHQLQPSDEFQVAPAICPAYLNELGLLERLPEWRTALTNRPAGRRRPARSRRRARAASAKRRTASVSPEVEPAETNRSQVVSPVLSDTPPPRTANDLPAPAAATVTATLGQPESENGMVVAPASRRRHWVYAGVTAAVLCFLALWFGMESEQPIRALAPAPLPSKAPLAVSPAATPEPAPAAVPEATPAMESSEETTIASAVSEDAPEPDAAPAPSPAPSLPEPEPTATAAQPVTTPSAPPPAEQPLPEFRISGIIYTVARPAAIVNRQTVFVGDQVSGATVVAIDRTHVTLKINGQRQTYVLR